MEKRGLEGIEGCSNGRVHLASNDWTLPRNNQPRCMTYYAWLLAIYTGRRGDRLYSSFHLEHFPSMHRSFVTAGSSRIPDEIVSRLMWKDSPPTTSATFAPRYTFLPIYLPLVSPPAFVSPFHSADVSYRLERGRGERSEDRAAVSTLKWTIGGDVLRICPCLNLPWQLHDAIRVIVNFCCF